MQSSCDEIVLSDTSTSQAAQRCPTCNSDLSMPGFDLGSAAESHVTAPAREMWLQRSNCALCRTIVAVILHAQETFHSLSDFMTIHLEPTTSGQYLLYLDEISMPVPPERSAKHDIRGSIAIYLRGQCYCVFGDAFNKKNRTQATYSSKGLRAHHPACCY
jgi:hypothetical protein